MLDEKDIQFIKTHEEELRGMYHGIPPSEEIRVWLSRRFYRDCWTCTNQIKNNLLNLFREYDRITIHNNQ